MGVACMPLLVEVMARRLGVRSTLQIMGVFVAALFPCALVWTPTYRRDLVAKASDTDRRRPLMSRIDRFLNCSIWTNEDYVMWAVAMAVSAIGRLVPAMYLVRRLWCVVEQAMHSFS